jgi:hypothetical protein
MLPVAHILLPIFFLLYWSISAAVLWWAYDISPLIRGGYYERQQALVLVMKMALIVTVLTGVLWSFLIRLRKNDNARQGALAAALLTALVLAGYAIVVIGWRQFSGTPASDNAFVPIVGSINSHFFSEAGGLSFVLNVAPIMGCISGILYFIRCRSILVFSRS